MYLSLICFYIASAVTINTGNILQTYQNTPKTPFCLSDRTGSVGIDLLKFPCRASLLFLPCQTCLCLSLCPLLFFSDHLTPVALRRNKKEIRHALCNVNTLTNGYHMCPLRCTTMGDPAWSFVFAAREFLAPHGADGSSVAPLKFPFFVPQTRGSVNRIFLIYY